MHTTCLSRYFNYISYSQLKNEGYDVDNIRVPVVKYNLDNIDESSSYLWGAPGEEFGYLANLYLYDKKLTATEILQNYNTLKDRFGL